MYLSVMGEQIGRGQRGFGWMREEVEVMTQRREAGTLPWPVQGHLGSGEKGRCSDVEREDRSQHLFEESHADCLCARPSRLV